MTAATEAPIHLDQSDIRYLRRFYSPDAIEAKVREGRFVIVEQPTTGVQHESINSNKR